MHGGWLLWRPPLVEPPRRAAGASMKMPAARGDAAKSPGPDNEATEATGGTGYTEGNAPTRRGTNRAPGWLTSPMCGSARRGKDADRLLKQPIPATQPGPMRDALPGIGYLAAP